MLNRLPVTRLAIPIVMTGVFVCALPPAAHAQLGPSIDQITQQYQGASQQIATSLQTYAQALFWSLAAIQFTGSSIRLAIAGADAQEWAAHLVRQILFIGIYAWLMQNAYAFSLDILNSMRQAGNAAGGTGLDAGNIFSVGLKIAAQISRAMSVWDPYDAVLFAVAAIAIIVAFGFVAAFIVVALCEAYVLIAAGVLMTGFGGSEWTRDIANKTFSLALGIGAKLFIMEILVAFGDRIMQGWAGQTYNTNIAVLAVLGATLVFLVLTWQLPSLAQQFVSSAASGSTAAGAIRGLTSAAASAALAATGVGAAAAAALEAGGKGGGAASGGTAGEGGSSALPGGSGAQGALFGGSSGAPNPAVGGGVGSPLGRANLGQIGRALSRGMQAEMRGRITGVGIKGGTTGGRIAAYIRDPSLGQQQSGYPPPPPHHPPNGGNEIS